MTLYVARQPIFDIKRKVYAYELLFRSGTDNFFANTDPEHASSQVIHNSLFVYGLDGLLGGKKGFINITKKILLDEVVTILPTEHVVIELLETIEPDEEVVEACKKLKKLGYMLALDDFIDSPKMAPLVALADIIKIDFLLTKGQERKDIADYCLKNNIKILAEKVETVEEYHEAIELGYSYFQGYFFCKPEIVEGKDIPAFKFNYIRFFAAINRSELDYEELEEIIKQEVSLSVNILRYLNSAVFGFRTKISSIKQALHLLGDIPIKKWAMLLTMNKLGDDKPPELVVTALVRARFCEQLGYRFGLGNREFELFMLGMLSLIDALVDRPIHEMLDELAVAPEIKNALLKKGFVLDPVFEMVVTYEQGNWEKVTKLINQRRPKIDEDYIARIYEESVSWAEKIYQMKS